MEISACSRDRTQPIRRTLGFPARTDWLFQAPYFRVVLQILTAKQRGWSRTRNAGTHIPTCEWMTQQVPVSRVLRSWNSPCHRSIVYRHSKIAPQVLINRCPCMRKLSYLCHCTIFVRWCQKWRRAFVGNGACLQGHVFFSHVQQIFTNVYKRETYFRYMAGVSLLGCKGNISLFTWQIYSTYVSVC